MAKYKTFDEYLKGEKIVRFIDYFKRCWDFATDAAEENGSSHNTGSLPLCRSCIKLHACTGASDLEKYCFKYEGIAAQQQASA